MSDASKTNWTPGPLAIWGVQESTEIGGFYMIGAESNHGGPTAYVAGRFDAALYVSAPDMHEALNDAREELADIRDSVFEGEFDAITSIISKIDAALAKARTP